MQDSTFGNLIAWLAIAMAILGAIVLTPAWGASKTLVFLAIPDCDYGDLVLAKQYIGKRYDVVCMFGVDIETLENRTVPALRAIYPVQPLLFIISGEQFETYMQQKDGVIVANAGGRADIPLGYAVVKLDHSHLYQVVTHELLHLQLCAVHRNGPMEPVEDWERVAVKPWC